jgi:hypothetical protein
MITQSELKELLNYNQDTGIFTWKIPTRKIKVGDNAGYINEAGYVRLTISHKKYFAHRLAWLYVYGNFSKDTIDHINGNKSDNRISNLREATFVENKQNSKKSTKNTSGSKNVVWNKNCKKWQVQISLNRKLKYIGVFDNLEFASFVADEVRDIYHKEFARKQ